MKLSLVCFGVVLIRTIIDDSEFLLKSVFVLVPEHSNYEQSECKSSINQDGRVFVHDLCSLPIWSSRK